MAEAGTQLVPASRASWLVIFTDLVALLLTFFVMLFSMSNVQVAKWTEMIDALSQTLNPARTEKSKVPTARYNISTEIRRRAINLDYLNAVIGEKIKDDPLLSQSTMVGLDDRLVISLPGALLFEGKGVVLSEKGRELLFNLGGILRLVDNQVGVNSYVAAGTHEDTAFASEWELSLGRSIAVNNHFVRAGYPDTILSFGYGAARTSLLKVVPEARRSAFAQRVDIVVLSASNTR